jgi:hypothetical protein
MSTRFEKLRTLEYNRFVPADNHDARAFANLAEAVGHPIPSDYLDFLAEFPDTGVFDAEGGVVVEGIERLSGNHDGWHSIHMLYAGCSDEYYDLLAIAKRPQYDGDTPRYLLRIGENSFGNGYCLDLRPETLGKVFFWDHEHSADESGLYLVAHDFMSFVNGLEIDR